MTSSHRPLLDELGTAKKHQPGTSSEQLFQGPQPERAGSVGWCAAGPCSQLGRIASGPAGSDEAERHEATR